MEELLREILREVREINNRQNRALDRLAALAAPITDMEGWRSEYAVLAKAVLNQEAAVRRESPASDAAAREQLGRLEAKYEVLNARLFSQEAEIAQLQAVR